jgi:hypothetical protein
MWLKSGTKLEQQALTSNLKGMARVWSGTRKGDGVEAIIGGWAQHSFGVIRGSFPSQISERLCMLHTRVFFTRVRTATHESVS